MEDLDCIAFTKGVCFLFMGSALAYALINRTWDGYTLTSRSAGSQDTVTAVQHPLGRGEPLRGT